MPVLENETRGPEVEAESGSRQPVRCGARARHARRSFCPLHLVPRGRQSVPTRLIQGRFSLILCLLTRILAGNRLAELERLPSKAPEEAPSTTRRRSQAALRAKTTA